MSLVGQYDMDLFTSIFSLLYVPVPGFQLDNLLPDEVSPLLSTSSLHACFCAPFNSCTSASCHLLCCLCVYRQGSLFGP